MVKKGLKVNNREGKWVVRIQRRNSDLELFSPQVKSKKKVKQEQWVNQVKRAMIRANGVV